MKFSSPVEHFVFETFFRGLRRGAFLQLGSRRDGTALGRVFEEALDWRGLRLPPGDGAVAVDALLEKNGLREIDLGFVEDAAPAAGWLRSLEAARSRPRVLCIRTDPRAIAHVPHELDYEFVARIGEHAIFRRRDVRPLATTTVICAVWHGDSERWERLRGHEANLDRQSVPIERIYVFDGEDEPPAWLSGRKIAVRERLTIYQAWNVALSLVATPFVMNLNLDDRLAPDAIATLYAALAREPSALAGGDWRICFTQADTDAVESCYPADRLPWVDEWPPPAGTSTRLGSGTGSRGTYGPAVLWRMDAHVGIPRYPWRLADGSLLRIAGDAAWWSLLQDRLHKKLLRVPAIIGHYHSHPATQAEFRGDVDETDVSRRVGLSLL
jgi:hypothetical protein